ncbi:regulator of chromosome condensation-like isoform X2 [Oncorhynchus nerka]|uniref:regulator of chromosome condensation-like isoform X2 n=1 Tax=Oncorhynchus nerka TaxID=8023 RepID=UPI0011310E84|nr:regulator of chromosome condensation-like isoform X2 [Oncorhynchus nerka]
MSAKKAPKRPKESKPEEVKDPKKVKVSHSSHGQEKGLVLVLGQGDVGQLGLGEDIMERKRPALVTLPEGVVQVAAGGMHTVCLSDTGYDNSGVIGLLEPMKKVTMPVKVPMKGPVMKIASGNDHLVMLTASGDLYTSGCGEQGQLGRVPELFANRGGRKGLLRLLIPQIVKVQSRGKVHFTDTFCGAYMTIAVSKEGHVYGFGLSNYHQLGTKLINTCFVPIKLTTFKNSTINWIGFSGGQHHTVCLDSAGKVYSLGRAEYGRLGLGQGAEEKSEPTPVEGLDEAQVVACGASVSYAVTKQGSVYAWGMGTNLQLGTGEEDDEWSPVEMTGKQLENRIVLMVASGGQHTVLLVKDKQES